MAMGYTENDESAFQNGANVSLNDSYYFYNDTSITEPSFVEFFATPPPFPKPTAVVMAKVFAFVLNIIVTIIGNTIVITIILRNKNKNMRSATYYYLMNLAIADLIVACFSEWTLLAGLLKEGEWPFGAFMCKFSTFIQAVSVHVSILTLMVVAGDRYIAILHPIKSRVVKRNAWLVIAAVWLFSTAINIPLVLNQHYIVHQWDNGEIRKYCFEHWGVIGEQGNHWELAKELYSVCVFVFVYVVPLMLMSVAYVRIGMTLSYRSVSGPGVTVSMVKATMSVQDKARRKVVKMMIVVVITFALCWLPYHIYNLYKQFHGTVMDWNIFFFIIWLGYANSAMNPFIYCGFNENFRRGFRDAFTGRWCRRESSHQKLPNGTNTKSVTTTMFTHSDHIDPTSMESML